jgi:hypothetical protein
MGTHLRRGTSVLAAAVLAVGMFAGPAAADEHDRLEVLTDGLNNPRGITIAPDGTIYVAEAGTGGDDLCVPFEDEEICMGTTSRVVAIDADGTVTPVVEGLPSLALDEGEYVGAADVVVADDGSLYIAIGFGADSPSRDAIAEEWAPAAMLGTIQHADGETLTQVADLAVWETENDPDADQPSTQGPQGQPSDHSNPNGLLLTSDGRLLAADAGGNTVLEVDPDTGDITMVAFLEDRFAPAPPFLQLPPGTEIPMQAVPTNLAEAADGSVLISQLTGFPFPVGGANVYALTETTTPDVELEGFTNAMDLVLVDDDLYVVEFAQDGLLAGPAGALVRVRPDGTRVSLLRDDLPAPGGVAADADGMLHLTINSIGAPGSGAVLRFDPSLAADPAIQSACPPLQVAGSALSDIAGTTHEEAITCAAWHGLFNGFDDGTFRPGTNITRGQFATTVAGLIRASDAELPSGPSEVFTDVDGTTHASAINDLAAAGLVNGFDDGTYRPRQNLTRGQAVTILVAAYEFVTDTTVPAGDETFGDTEGTTHATAIHAAAGMGWVLGTGEGNFSPNAPIIRGQMASVLARVASDLVDGGHLELPS